MKLGFVVFLFLLASFLYLANRHVHRWATRAFSLGPRAQRVLKVFLLIALTGMFVGRFASRIGVNPFVSALIGISSTIELAVLISFGLLLPIDAVRGIARLARFVRERGARATAPSASTLPAPVASPSARSEPAQPAPVASPSAPSALVPAPQAEVPRRAFLTQAAAGSAFLIGTSSSLYGAFAGRHDYQVEEVPVKLPGLARALDGFTIVQLSDLHIGVFTGDAELAAALDLVKQARPDLIVLTGDLLDNDPRLASRLGRFVRELSPLAREGVAAIAGNHDFFAGVEPTAAAIEAGGGRALRNRGERIGDAGGGFALLGVDDVWATRMGGGPDVQGAIASLPRIGGRVAPARDLPRVLLCHNPSYFEHAAGQIDLQLSGHTHGGQVNLVVRPADLVLPHGWIAGRYTRNGSELYVNRGFGTVGPPARLGAPPEVTRIVLVAS